MLDRTLEAEWTRARRSKAPLSLIAFDIDHFKQYNDRYGHVKGDECLVKVANAIVQMPLRSTDLFARYGGEEFVLVLPQTHAEAALQLAERCRTAVSELQIPHLDSPGNSIVTISVGVSTMIPSGDSPYIVLFERADKLLYQAKQNGRNRVCSC